MRAFAFLLMLAVVAGCATRSREVVVVADNRGGRQPRGLTGVPPGQFPRPGQCRIWFAGRPPGRQPRAASCESLVGRVPRGAFLLYNARAWDADYDWRDEARRNPGSVPDIVLRLLVEVEGR